MHVDTDTVLLALAILAHGWLARVPVTRSTIFIGSLINAIAVMVVLLLLFFGWRK